LNRLIILVAILFIHISCVNVPSHDQEPAIITGAQQLDKLLPLIEGKRVALLVNHTSLVDGKHLVDTLKSMGTDIVKVFAPEHGFRGQADAGEVVRDGRDSKTNIPIVSLYGSNKKPTPEQMNDIDVVIFDIQDVGVRFYTYISSMQYVMEACAENGKTMVVLDRPNPNGRFIDGPVLEEEFSSFVGLNPIPVLHGLTVAEMAQMINGEGWLSEGATCQLEVIPMRNYNHNLPYSLPVKPSPNLPNDLSIQLYPSLCLFEGTVISVGRGTYEPFQQIGHPALTMYSHTFTPASIDGMSKNPPFLGETCYGTLFTSNNAVQGFDLSYLIDFYNNFPDKEKFFNSYFEKLAGTAELRQQIISGTSPEAIRASWQAELDDFKNRRKAYLLYP